MQKLTLAILLLPLFCVSQPEKTVVDEIVAVVGQNIVLQSDIEVQYANYISQGAPVNDETKCIILEELLFQTLLLNQAEVDSVDIADSQVEGELERRLRFFIQQIGSEKKLEDYYNKSIEEIKEEFRDLIKDQMMIQQMQAQITSSVKVTPAEVKNYFNSIPTDSLPFINSEVEIAQIVINAPVSPEAREIAREKIMELKERVIKGESFSTMAVLYSEDPGSSKKGGELGYMGRGELVSEFAGVAFKLKGTKVSEIVETKYGFHIMQLIDRKGEKVNVRHILIKPKTDNTDLLKAKAKLDSIKTLIENDTLSFSEAAVKFSQDEFSKNSNGNIMNPQSGNNSFEMDQLDPSIFFIIDKMKPGDISEPIPYTTMEGKQAYRIIKLKTRTEPHVANLKDDYHRIQSAALTNKQNEAINEWITKKVKNTYIRLNEGYTSCSFTNPWITQNP